MTDLTKAIAFATHCLKWVNPIADFSGLYTFIWSEDKTDGFRINDAKALQELLEEFLGKKYCIQANRGTSTEFQWRVIVGWQDGTDKSVSTDHAVGVGEDLWDAIFDACIAAVGLTPAG